jgi:2-polyprenyl-6-methoxyphenol hydroxylase-like FAD-dependent oxidoreductase
LQARYVIGADGAHSTIRSGIGLDFPGTTYPSQFVLADVELAAPPSADDEVTISMSGEGVTVIGRLPSGNYRIIATVDAASEVPAVPDAACVQALLRRRDVDARLVTEPAWSSRFRVQHRVAERFRSAGVFLAGDAAHVHSPAAGQGMNTGIADSFDLSTRLAAVLTGHAAETELDEYERSRRPAALQVLSFTDRLTKISMVRNPIARRIRRIGAHIVGGRKPVQRRITMSISGLERSPLRHHLPAVKIASAPHRGLVAPGIRPDADHP